MSRHELAQLNIATLLAPLDSPALADFVAELDTINALAEAAPGFVWRFETDAGNATAAEHPFGEDKIVNMSTWVSIEALHDYVYRTAHTEVMARRREWFARMRDAYSVLWWVPRGHRPTPAEAHERLERLRAHGPGEAAFTFKRAWPAPDAPAAGRPAARGFDDLCPAG